MMHRFAPALRRVASELDLARDARAEILLEMAADLEAVYAHHRARGIPEEEAAQRAEDAVLGSSEVVRRLTRLHVDRHRWADELAARLTGGLDLLLLILGVLPMVVIAGLVATHVLAADPAGPLAWLLIAIGVALIVTITAEWLRHSSRAGAPRHLPLLLVLSLLSPAVGLLAATLGTYAAFVDLASSDATQAAVAARLARDGATLVLGLVLGLTGALSWFVLLNRSRARLTREVDQLLATGSVPVPGLRADIVPLIRRRSS